MPFEYDPDAGEHGALIGHMARGNDHWRQPAQGEAMIAHVYGELVVHDDPVWTEARIRRLTDHCRAAAASGYWGACVSTSIPRPWAPPPSTSC
ncbi:FMN-binding negative transcriptional regulator [Streptomyces sp. Inha503]|uniref:FMN-binding negative transcriptional regulator n=1 Tax=Streptomyces sp. Inha503 TaxID=3383314 RepID=UPI0039A04232